MIKRLALLVVLTFASVAIATVPTTSSSSTLAGNGSTTVFPTHWPFLQNDDVVVKLVDNATGVATVQSYGTHYTVTGAGSSSGDVTFLTAPPAGKTVVIERTVPLMQSTNFRAQGTFRPATHENAFDRVVMGLQQIDRKVGELADAGVTVSAEFGTVSSLRFSGDGTLLATAKGQAFAWFTMAACASSPCAISQSYNVASVSRGSTGAYVVTFTTPAATSNIVSVCNVGNAGGLNGFVTSGPINTSAFTVQTYSAAAASADLALRCVVFGG